MPTTTSTTTLATPSLPGKAPRASAVAIRHRRLPIQLGSTRWWYGSGRSTSISCDASVTAAEASTSSSSPDNEEARVGSRVRVKVPLKVYHVQKVPEVDLMGMEGEIKHYVGVYKGMRISANLPFRVQFAAQIDGRDVRFFAHLKEDEFDYISS
ncbi:hypothetical protein QJS04_geneDACA014755 [Acorus gramineus]|uniref:Ferredoxin thioredoxin reductase alpha chain domain-containing protein n=1 Tax=Acorus gramineus TaxID=55184 RepID=A0AAV9BRB1_ACOGR|nr:hypothetical protein QJS04_geneDACA014755 [Acorus gramineus]